MINRPRGFILVEAVAAVVVMSVCLTMIAQSLMTNFRTGMRFQENVQALLALQDQMGLLCAARGIDGSLLPRQLEAPYAKFILNGHSSDAGGQLEQVELTLNWTNGKREHSLEAVTLIYDPQADQK